MASKPKKLKDAAFLCNCAPDIALFEDISQEALRLLASDKLHKESIEFLKYLISLDCHSALFQVMPLCTLALMREGRMCALAQEQPDDQA